MGVQVPTSGKTHQCMESLGHFKKTTVIKVPQSKKMWALQLQ